MVAKELAQCQQCAISPSKVEAPFIFSLQMVNELHSMGLWAAYRHAFEVCLGVLLVAWLAHHVGRPDLIHARSRLLAPC